MRHIGKAAKRSRFPGRAGIVSRVSRNVAIAMPLLADSAQLDARGLEESWRSLWPDDPVLTSLIFREGAAAFEAEGVVGGAMVMPCPIPHDQAAGLASGSWLWQDAAEVGRGHRAHVVVSASTSGPALAAFQVMTRAAAAVTRSTGASGVYMGGAGLGIRGELFTAMAEKLPIPVALWVNLHCFPAGTGCGLVTVGLGQFGIMELEVPASPKPCGELRMRILELAEWLIEQRPAIADGDTIGASADERVKVVYAPSMVDRDGPVYQLNGL